MIESARLTVSEYADRGGVPFFADDVDDIYERFYNWGLFYAMCGEDGRMPVLNSQCRARRRTLNRLIVRDRLQVIEQ